MLADQIGRQSLLAGNKKPQPKKDLAVFSSACAREKKKKVSHHRNWGRNTTFLGPSGPSFSFFCAGTSNARDKLNIGRYSRVGAN